MYRLGCQIREGECAHALSMGPRKTWPKQTGPKEGFEIGRARFEQSGWSLEDGSERSAAGGNGTTGSASGLRLLEAEFHAELDLARRYCNPGNHPGISSPNIHAWRRQALDVEDVEGFRAELQL